MIIKSEFNFRDTNEEILPMDVSALPHVCMIADLNQNYTTNSGWHWHEALEIDYVTEGAINFVTVDEVLTLPEGSAIFLNSNVLHNAVLPDGTHAGLSYAQLFQSDFLSGGVGNNIERKYIHPVLGNPSLPYFCLYPDRPEDARMLALIRETVCLCRKESFGYEFRLRELLCHFWMEILTRFTSALRQKRTVRKNDEERLKLMLRYIRHHYMDKISLDDIADAASISSRECSRCFLRTIRTAPMQYLKQYRLEQAASFLLSTSQNITEISENCGFFSNSYFSRCFREKYGCTPREYQRQDPSL